MDEKSLRFFCILFLVLLPFLSSCSSKEAELPGGTVDISVPDDENSSGKADEEYVENRIEEEGLPGVPGEDGIVEPPGDTVSEGRTSGPMLPVYFDFDSYVISEGMVGRMESNARYLIDHPSVRIEIQGNCDDRGTSEYNLALGEKRAMAAKRYLVNLGVKGDRIDVVSLGEEKPLARGNDESAWAMNRRDDFVIINK